MAAASRLRQSHILMVRSAEHDAITLEGGKEIEGGAKKKKNLNKKFFFNFFQFFFFI
jgi:hypothetical protein